jgi:hypothetical protein
MSHSQHVWLANQCIQADVNLGRTVDYNIGVPEYRNTWYQVQLVQRDAIEHWTMTIIDMDWQNPRVLWYDSLGATMGADGAVPEGQLLAI